MGKVYAGTSGFAYSSWKPQFYPAKLPAAKFLSFYASKLSSTEVNYTFRRTPTAKTLAGWESQTPDGFVFACKAHMRITHVLRLRGVEEALRWFLESLEPLGAKLGPVLFQLPPNSQANWEALAEMLALVPKSVRCAFEFRHPSWFADPVYKVLERHGATLCWAETEDLTTPEVRTAPFVYFRMRKSPYDAAQRAQIAERVAAQLKSGDAYVYFKHEETPEGALDAEDLLQRLGAGSQ